MKKCLTTLTLFLALIFSAQAQDDGTTLNFMFSPHPVKDICYLEVNQPVRLVVLDLRGEVVLEKKLFTSGDLDMRLIEEGIYFLQLSTQDQVKTQRLIKSSFH
ncbi:MAG: T9SS type A sorting domain-containing protein [Flavobacteriales bacterium]